MKETILKGKTIERIEETVKKNFGIKNTLINFLFAWIYVTLLEHFLTFCFNCNFSLFFYPVMWCVFFLLFSIMPLKTFIKKLIVLNVPLLILATVYITLYGVYKNTGNFKAEKCYAEDFFSDKKVMIIVPHEDDDINIMGGVIENFVECGSELIPVFVTNGDLYGLGEVRINEAITCWEKYGVPEENIYFLGYGDRWSRGGPHIYNAPADEQMTSAVGRTETYGTESHPAYHNGIPYTNRNYSNDIKQLILEKKPDVLFIIDFDVHIDHRAVSLMSECVLGEIFEMSDDYRPIVYKGYAYWTAWHSVDDYFSVNVKSSIMAEDTENQPIIYDWNKRVRLPVNEKSLTRSLFSNSSYRAMEIYDSQDAVSHATKIINGDKVFWQRRTDSILYDAAFSATSGDVSHIADFRLLDSTDLLDDEHMPYDGVWIPDKKDAKKKLHVRLKKASDITQIHLYDNPSPQDNITNIRISFSDGTSIDTEELNADGSVFTVDVNKKNIKSFDIRIMSYEGENPGLCEVEAFSTDNQNDSTFIKIKDNEDNFVYYHIAEGETTEFSLYSNNQVPELDDQNYSVTCDNEKCSCEIKDNNISVTCPVNETCNVTLRELSSGLTDKITVSNPGALQRKIISIGQTIDEDAYYWKYKSKENRLSSTKFMENTKLFLKALRGYFRKFINQ